MNAFDFFILPAGLAEDAPPGLLHLSTAILGSMVDVPQHNYMLADVADVAALLFASGPDGPAILPSREHMLAGETIALLLAHSGLVEPFTAQCGNCPREHEFVRVSEIGHMFLSFVASGPNVNNN